jgi:dihydroorotate dehydrogenase
MANFFEKVLRPILFRLDAERAHELGLKALELGLVGLTAKPEPDTDGVSTIKRFGLSFKNPLGIAAGFDKNGKVVNQLARLGFGFVEVGTVTLKPQPGNPGPRLFRLPEDKALINRLGFNNEGAEAVAKRLKTIRRECVVGVNIGRNKNIENENAFENYLQTFQVIYPVADYISVNVSSPNTPNLRDLQAAEKLGYLLRVLQEKNREMGYKPLLVKVAPDLSDADIRSIVETCMQAEIDGIIATNTTIERDRLTSKFAKTAGPGGLSGRPLYARSNQVISTIYKTSNGRLPIIGVGGIFTAQDAFEKIAAGASLLQAYTGFVFSGPSFARDVVSGLSKLLRDRGFHSVDEVVGTNLR